MVSSNCYINVTYDFCLKRIYILIKSTAEKCTKSTATKRCTFNTARQLLSLLSCCCELVLYGFNGDFGFRIKTVEAGVNDNYCSKVGIVKLVLIL